VHMLAEGFSTRRGRRSAYLHRDAVNKRLRGRRGARLTAVTCGGAIPDNADYQVVLEPAQIFIGTLNEDFAIESMAGDIFQLGNASYRIVKIEPGRVRVEDAQGQPPSIPFWLGEANARTDELSAAVSRLRKEIEQRLGEVSTASIEATVQWATQALRLSPAAARQLVEYLAAAKGVLGVIPSQDTMVMERFFDETGGMQLVIHAPFGSRINRAWGLTLRKRFCRQFNFELQAAATEDAIVLSLGETHSFPLDEVARYLHSHSAREVLIQALLDAPLFNIRWRWNATIALAIKRFRGGKKNPAPLQRMDADDLMAVVFPDQLACAENLAGSREIPDHPLVNQTIADCLYEAMDIAGFIALLQALEIGEKKIIARDLPHPSPLALEILNSKPYTYLDDAPLEERRTQAVLSRRWIDPATAADFGKLDLAAIQQVREEAWPTAENADELHDALLLLGFVTEQEAEDNQWADHFEALLAARRATRLRNDGTMVWTAAEALPMLQAVLPNAELQPAIAAPAEFTLRKWPAEEALIEIVRGRLQGLGPVTAAALAQSLSIGVSAIDAALMALESEGFVLRGQFTPDAKETEWCERRLLARIHRYTIKTLRAEIEPVAASDFLRFLFDWHGLTTDPRPEGPQALAAIVEQLEGFETAATAWEGSILPARIQDYDPASLDSLCLSGRITWARLTPQKFTAGKDRNAGPVRTTPIALLMRKNIAAWHALVDGRYTETPQLSHAAQAVADYLGAHGASFFDEIAASAGLLKSQAEEALGELVAFGLINSDSYSGLRTLLIPSDRRRAFSSGRRRRRVAVFGLEEAGRWTLLRRATGEKPAGSETTADLDAAAVEQSARILLRRYGVVFRKVIEREAAWLPPWYALLRVYRRLEARGEIRGGRFVAGFSGEQYALPEAVGALRAMRKKVKSNLLVSVSAADPLNLVGVLTPGARVPALAANRVLYRDGIPIAVQIGGETRFLSELDPSIEWEARNALLRQTIAPSLRTYLS